jgi:hypothetical protein
MTDVGAESRRLANGIYRECVVARLAPFYGRRRRRATDGSAATGKVAANPTITVDNAPLMRCPIAGMPGQRAPKGGSQKRSNALQRSSDRPAQRAPEDWLCQAAEQIIALEIEQLGS